jgi:hypothetical protein
MRAFVMLPALAVLAALLAPAPARAQDPRPMSMDELADARGGFIVANGVTLGFGATVRTFVDGQLALESRLTWTETGAVTEHSGGLEGAADLASAIDAALAQGLDLEGLQNGQGLLLSDASGATALVHNLRNGSIQNLIVNNASGRDLRQEIEITLTLPDLASMQRQYSFDRIGSQIGQDMNSALLQALR